MKNDQFFTDLVSAVQRKDCEAIVSMVKDLEKADRRCRILLEEANDAILIFEPECGKIVECNTRTGELFGRPVNELIGSPVSILHPEKEHHTICEEFHQLAAEHKHFRMTMPVVRGDGTQLHVEATFAQLDLGNGTVIQGFYRDVSDRIQLQEDLEARNRELEEKNRQLEEAQQLRTQFLATISHELRTPLNAIIGFNSLMEERIYGELNSKQQKAVQRIDRNATRLLSLINQLLDLSRLEAGAMAVFYEPADLVQLAKDVFDDYEAVAEEKGISLDLSHPHKGVELSTDAGKVREIIRQLVSNAVKFTQQGRISIAIQKCEQGATLEVKDSGPGIDADKREAIFELFRQCGKFHTRQHEGAGLGLAIVHRMAKLLNICVEVESQPGEGATFRLHIPEKAAEKAGTANDKSPALVELKPKEPETRRFEPCRTSDCRHAVIVDDDPYTVEILAEFLETKGHFHVTKAYSGMHAMIHLAKSRPDYLLVDLLMPQINGERVIQCCRDLWGRDVTIIVITGKTLEPSEMARLKEHVHAVVCKGDLRPQSLAETLESIMPVGQAAG